MTDTLCNIPRYIRNTDAFGWQGADGPNGPWRSITPPQSGTPWKTTNAMDDLRQAAPVPAGEVADEARYLVKELRDQADDLSPSLELFGLIHRAADLLECQATACAICERERLHQSTRAADLEVERQAAPVPVAVSTEEEDAK